MINYRKKRLTPEQKVQLVSDYNAGLPILTLTERFSIHRTTLYRILREPLENYEK